MSTFRKQHMPIEWHDMIDEESTVPAVDATLHEKATLVARMGQMMLSVGTSAWRVRAAMNKVARALGVTLNADIGLVTITWSCIDGDRSENGTIALPTTGVNTHRLMYLKEFSDGFAERAERYSVTQFHRILDKIAEMPLNYKAWQLALASGLACCAFTFLLGGGPVEMAFAFVGAAVGQFLRKKLIEGHITLLANVTAAVMAGCLTYSLLMLAGEKLFGLTDTHRAGYICSMLFVIPGFPLITGFIDLAKLDLRSGLERLTYAALIIGMATLTGFVTAHLVRFAPGSFTEKDIPLLLLTLLRMVCSFCGVYGFSYLFNTPRKVAATADVIGMIANTLRLTLISVSPIPPVVAVFLGSLTAGLLASLTGTFRGYPRICITVPSIVIMVPGMYMYKGIYYLAQASYAEASSWLCGAVTIVLAIPLGLIFARILTDTNFRRSS